MSLLDRFRRERAPAEAVADLPPGERVLSWAPVNGGFVVAMRRGMRLPDGRDLPWHRIDKATWRDGELALTEAVEAEPGVLDSRPPLVLPLAEPRDLPAVVRTRVTQSVAHSARHPLPGGGAVRVVARRVPGQDSLDWSVRFDPGVDRDDPVVRAAAEGLLTDARASMTPSE